MTRPSENASFINSMTYFLYSSSYNPSVMQKIVFELKLVSQGSIEQDHLSKNVKKFGSDKRSISVMNQSKNQQFMTCYSSLQFILFKMSINNPLKWTISAKIVFLQQAQFFQVWSPYYMQAKNYDLPPSFSENYFW